ncbi:hypothetical protein TTHT_0782 [Thermotomaculum hydrothermale]|uniref:EF-hand domain-containing protein n=1 Tax=Thermotomaculum hydrothermale TaxID=981385 RepID=A0A7R6PML7_9BACT|nr:hypothetical protein [Thermotomaculum hydrothermale]BBB32348.1 hypothetical protein TTHT_0782 [Thermotomaculum hydrothermale]
MENWSTVMVPTFYDETKELDREKLKKIADISGYDVVTLKNVFTGRGLGFISKTPDIEKINRITAGLKSAGIPFLPANYVDVVNEIKEINAKRINLANDGIKVVSNEGDSYIIKDTIIVVSDIKSQEVLTLKKAIISAEKIAIVTKEAAFVIDFSNTVILDLDGKKGVSRKANLINTLEKFKEKNEVVLDSTFFYQSGFFKGDLVLMSRFIAYALKYGLYSQKLPDSLFKKVSFKQKPVYNHKIINNSFKIMSHLLKKNFKDNIVYLPAFTLTVMFILIYFSFRTGDGLYLFFATLLGFIVFTYKMFRVWKIKQIIEDTPTSKLRSIAAGFVEVSGKITSPKPVISPISGSPCVFFRYTKEKFVRSGRNSRWVTVEIGEGCAENCVLRDETGEIGVNVKNASFFLTNLYTTNTTFNEMQYGLFGADNVRYKEEYILDGQKVYVLGTAKPISKSISYGKFLSEIKKDKEKMKKFDLDGNGVIDFEEWEIAQKKLRDEFLEYKQLKGQAADLLIDYDRNNGIFVISNEKERSILKRLKIALPLYFIGSLVCLVLTLWLTVNIF